MLACLVSGADPARAEDAAADSSAHEAATDTADAGLILPTRDAGNDEPTPWFLEATLASRYLSQGIDYGEGRAAVQPEGMLTAADGLSIDVWANLDLGRGRLDEFNLSVQQAAASKALGFLVGLTALRYPNREDWQPTHEIFGEVSLRGTPRPSLEVRWDFDAATGITSTLSLSHEGSAATWSSTFTGRVFWQSGYYGVTGIPAAELNVERAFALRDVTLAASVSRFFTWENGSFRDFDRVDPSWWFALRISAP
jgi:hypothetical protein